MNDFPTGDPHCPDCNGTGRYQGLGAEKPCRTCEKKEGDNASIEDALGFGDLVEEMFPGELKDEEGDPPQAVEYESTYDGNKQKVTKRVVPQKAEEEDPIQATVDAAPDLADPKWNDASKLKTFPPVPSFEEMHRQWWEKIGKRQSDLLREALYGPSP